MLNTELKNRLLEAISQPHGLSAIGDHVAEAELRLGVEFPENYRDFLLSIGWGGIGHHEFYGVGPTVPEFLNLVLVTLSERTRMIPALPFHLVPLMNDGAGNHYCLDTNHAVANDCPVVFWNHELGTDQESEVEADSLESWLGQLVGKLKDQTIEGGRI